MFGSLHPRRWLSPITALTILLALSSLTSLSQAATELPAIFSSNMVLQRNHHNPIWGWSAPGTKVNITFAGQTKQAIAGDDGAWRVTLEPMPAGGPYDMLIEGDDRITLGNILIGEVWICSGQSNMAWDINRANDPDLESLAAKFPSIRLISVPQVGTQEPQKTFRGEWQACTPETVRSFSAVGYFFGRQLHQTLDVPIGLIDNAWGGSACEAWINRQRLADNPRFAELMKHWEGVEQRFAENPDQRGRGAMRGNQRPANIYNGVLKPTIGYGIKGAIWYQGESNASRAYQYRDLFPFMIESWRDEWQQGDFPFYWVQLADFRDEQDAPADSDWAELREAQTMAQRLPNTGEAVIVDLGEAHDIHPKNKQDVAKRLARLALAQDYGLDLVHRSPRYASMEPGDGDILLTFDDVGGGLDTFDVRQPIGFTIAGEDRIFHPAVGQILGKGKGRTQVRVSSEAVPKPVAVRYAWADNPICNVQNAEGLPLTPFRTDEWPGITQGKEHR